MMSFGSKIICSRVQIPLQPSYGLTIHKSQGLEFNQLHIDLKGCFSVGQGYVALSRCKNVEKLSIANCTRQSFKCDEVVSKFYKELVKTDKGTNLEITEDQNKQIAEVVLVESTQSQDSFHQLSGKRKLGLKIIPETPDKSFVKRIRFQSTA